MSVKRAFTEEDLEEVWQERYNFCRTTLGLNDQKAREWADRTIRSFRETAQEFGY